MRMTRTKLNSDQQKLLRESLVTADAVYRQEGKPHKADDCWNLYLMLRDCERVDVLTEKKS